MTSSSSKGKPKKLVSCVVCGTKVREDRISKHLNKIHKQIVYRKHDRHSKIEQINQNQFERLMLQGGLCSKK